METYELMTISLSFFLDVLTLSMQEKDTHFQQHRIHYLQQQNLHQLQQQHLHDLQHQIQQSLHSSYEAILF